MRRRLRRIITAIARWGFTIMIVPKRGPVRRIVVPWVGVIALGLALGMIVYFPVGQWQQQQQITTIRSLKAQNRRLQKENRQIKPHLERARELETLLNKMRNEHAAVMSAYESIRRKSRSISSRDAYRRPIAYRLPPPVQSSDGAISLLATLEQQTIALNKVMSEDLAKTTELKRELLAYERRLDHTPSIWPVYGRLTSWFGLRRHPIKGYSTMHEGVDLAARTGSLVRAAADGAISYAGNRGGYGLAIIINHGYGYHTLYAHNSKLLVRVGQSVKKGQVIARSGSTGTSTGAHLHFEVWANGRKVNPLPFLR
ncbi:MAG: peptidoglycan DD-metalloendopeptidase family protein [Bacteroidota bacterium]